jgi:hypothetical protein
MNEFSEQLHNRPYSANTFPDNNYSLNREEAVPHEPATNVGGFSSSEMRASGIPRIGDSSSASSIYCQFKILLFSLQRARQRTKKV